MSGMESKIVKSDFKKLDAFAKAISSELAVRVGILGKKTNRTGGAGMTNADIGFIHEFGRGHNPRRSFLRMPLMAKSEEIVQRVVAAGALRKLGEGRIQEVLTDLGTSCEVAIGQAFDSRGFGDWEPNAPATVRHKSKGGKKGDAPLIETGQLRRSIASDVVKA